MDWKVPPEAGAPKRDWKAHKEAGPARVPQQWKEGLRQIVPDPLSAEQAEVEQLRVLLRRGAGIGTEQDDYTPYTGRSRDDIIQAAIRKYVGAQA